MALLVNAAGHDSDCAFAGRDDAGAVGADEPRFVEVDRGSGANHVNHRDAFRDADDERNFSVGGFENRVGSVWRRNENYGSVGARGLYSFLNGIEHRTFQVLGPTFAWGYATNDICPVFNHLLRMKSSFASRETLHDETRFFVYQHAHRAPPARATTFCAPSFMPSAIVKFRPLSRRIFWPSSTLVPSIRTTTGTFTCRSLAAATTPVARTSHRKIPPKMLMNTAFTPGSPIRMRKAFLT